MDIVKVVFNFNHIIVGNFFIEIHVRIVLIEEVVFDKTNLQNLEQGVINFIS